MIVVTVGTHEQQFNRLVEYMDNWAGEHDEEVVIQTGYSTYQPKHCVWQRFYKQSEMDDFIKNARIVVTHGGPCCYIEVVNLGKVPIVVPRLHALGEHVDDHQLEIGRELKKQRHNIILIEDINDLGDILIRYDEIIKGMDAKPYEPDLDGFCEKLSEACGKLFK